MSSIISKMVSFSLIRMWVVIACACLLCLVKPSAVIAETAVDVTGGDRSAPVARGVIDSQKGSFRDSDESGDRDQKAGPFHPHVIGGTTVVAPSPPAQRSGTGIELDIMIVPEQPKDKKEQGEQVDHPPAPCGDKTFVSVRRADGSVEEYCE